MPTIPTPRTTVERSFAPFGFALQNHRYYRKRDQNNQNAASDYFGKVHDIITRVRLTAARRLLCIEGSFKKTASDQVVALSDPFITFCDPQHQNLGVGVEHPLSQSASLFGALAPVVRVFYRWVACHDGI
jgi:hypothetical protein